MSTDGKGWISTKDSLPPIDTEVLVIEEIGENAGFSKAAYTNYGIDGYEFMFRPGGLKPNVNVRWWMPIPQDAWHSIEETQPEVGQRVLLKGMHGRIHSAWWMTSHNIPGKFEFIPFPGESIVFWREIPLLPRDDKLLAKLKLEKL